MALIRAAASEYIATTRMIDLFGCDAHHPRVRAYAAARACAYPPSWRKS